MAFFKPKRSTSKLSPEGKKNIIFVIDGLGMGGAERLMIPILENLNKEKFNARVGVLQSKQGNPLAEDILALGIPVDLLNVKHLRDLKAINRIKNYFNENEADIIHTQLEFSNILGNISAKLLGIPSICTIHVLPTLGGSLKSRLHQWVEWIVLSLFCNRVITVSDETRNNYIRHSGISSKKLVTIYNGIDLVRFKRIKPDLVRDSVRTEFGLPLDAFLLITVAVLRPPKGIEFMIRALSNIRDSYPNTYYLVVGNGEYRNVLMEETKQAGVEKYVIFAGNRKDVLPLLSASDVFVLPTLTEALPTVLAEAMACHLPIIASTVGGIPEMIQDGINGILVTPANPSELSDACKVLLGNSEKRNTMGENGWNVVKNKFDIEHQVINLEQQYLELIRTYEK